LVLLGDAPGSGHTALRRVYWIAAGGGMAHAIGRPADYLGLAASHRSPLLALGEVDGLHLLSLDGRWSRRLQPAGAGAFLAMPAWSSDGRRLAFLAAPRPHAGTLVERSLWIAGFDGRGARRILDARQTSDLLTMDWSPDGRTLLLSRFARGHGTISMLDLRTGRESVLAAGFDATWSPDGHRIAFDRRGRPGVAGIWLMDVAGHRARQLNISGLAQAAAPVWSPDGRSLAFFATASSLSTFLQPYGLWTAPASGGRPTLVASGVATLLPVGRQSLAWVN
jgi:Tol biopolymer transport system component